MRVLFFLLLTTFQMQSFSQEQFQKWQLFGLQGLIAKQQQSQNIYLRFLDEPSISAGIYALNSGVTDNQQPHLKDELYFILSGRSEFSVEHDTTPIGPGDVLFVRAGLDHKFFNIQEDLKILVWFSGSVNTDHDTDWKRWSEQELVAGKLDENTWNEYLEVPTLSAGLYQLPEKLGGDDFLTHETDEINYVQKGSAKFQVGEEVVEVYAGSIVYVKAGTSHRFYDLEGDFEVHIMFVGE